MGFSLQCSENLKPVSKSIYRSIFSPIFCIAFYDSYLSTILCVDGYSTMVSVSAKMALHFPCNTTQDCETGCGPKDPSDTGSSCQCEVGQCFYIPSGYTGMQQAYISLLPFLKSFPPCHSQLPLLTDFIPPLPPPGAKSGLKLVCNVNILYGIPQV